MLTNGLVLNAGSDDFLLSTRTNVLVHHGYLTAVAHSATQIAAITGIIHFDVVVLCHSFTSDEQSNIEAAVRVADPATRVLRMNGFEENDPTHFLRCVDGMALNSVQ